LHNGPHLRLWVSAQETRKDRGKGVHAQICTITLTFNRVLQASKTCFCEKEPGHVPELMLSTINLTMNFAQPTSPSVYLPQFAQ
jgi:hypothetical protein